MKITQGAHTYDLIEVLAKESQEFWAPSMTFVETFTAKNFCGREFKCVRKLLGLTREHWDKSYEGYQTEPNRNVVGQVPIFWKYYKKEDILGFQMVYLAHWNSNHH